MMSVIYFKYSLVLKNKVNIKNMIAGIPQVRRESKTWDLFVGNLVRMILEGFLIFYENSSFFLNKISASEPFWSDHIIRIPKRVFKITGMFI